MSQIEQLLARIEKLERGLAPSLPRPRMRTGSLKGKLVHERGCQMMPAELVFWPLNHRWTTNVSLVNCPICLANRPRLQMEFDFSEPPSCRAGTFKTSRAA